MKKSGKIYIGTSGWVYKDWGRVFFPKGLPLPQHLSYLAEHFNTVEINASFYRMQPPKNFERWRQRTPTDFRFAVKVSRFITHIKRMKAVRTPWKRFLQNARPLKQKQGPFLLQFPSSFTGKDEEVLRIDRFLTAVKKDRPLRLALEFRHQNCFREEMLRVLEKHRACLVFANSSKYPPAPWVTPADFVYFRLHGPKKLFSSSYSTQMLESLSRIMKQFLEDGKDLYVYFNNDWSANAPANAKILQRLLKRKTA